MQNSLIVNSVPEGKIELRPAEPDDFSMALRLYLITMEPLTSELMIWDEAKQRASFADQWKINNVQIIVFGGRDIGWLQSLETDTEIFLQQLFVSPPYQGRGIGSTVLCALLETWRANGKPIVLTVLKNNPARRLYERFGFKVVGEAGVKLRMNFDRSQLQ